jgi:hypothetical protein
MSRAMAPHRTQMLSQGVRDVQLTILHPAIFISGSK